MNQRNRIGILASIALLLSSSANALTVHEWGTFTSLVGSNGKTQIGLHHEEEPLPSFVYDVSRLNNNNSFGDIDNNNLFGNNTNGGTFPATRSVITPQMEQMPIPTFTEEVTQKMETPVLYFHSDKEMNVEVKVDFPKGVISQWFPATSSQNAVDKIRDGHATWKIKVLKDSSGQLPPTSPASVWNPSRQVKANTVEVNGEQERFIFYRGLAKFEVPLSYVITDTSVKVSNNSPQTIDNAYILKFEQGKGRIVAVGTIAANSTKEISLAKLAATKALEESTFLNTAANLVAEGLKADGLYADEAMSMVNTWKHSYFATEGLRFLYVLPREWTDELLPITIKPAPKSVVRTLVGRVEILTPAVEQELAQYASQNLSNSDTLSRFEISGREMKGLGHFPEPKLRRVMELNPGNTSLNKSLERLITSMNRGLLFR